MRELATQMLRNWTVMVKSSIICYIVVNRGKYVVSFNVVPFKGFNRRITWK